MLRFLSISAILALSASSANAGYSGNQYNNAYVPKKVQFPAAYQIIDPTYARLVFSRYEKCISTKCDTMKAEYSTDVEKCISTIASYTSCATACAATEMKSTISDFRDLLSNVINIGYDQLRITRNYLSGQEDYDVIANRVRINDSCCLPNDYFVRWERIMIPVTILDVSSPVSAVPGETLEPTTPPKVIMSQPYPSIPTSEPKAEPKPEPYHDAYQKPYYGRKLKASTSETSEKYMMSAQEYISHCVNFPENKVGDKDAWMFKISCDEKTVKYMMALQRNMGQLVLAPQCKVTAPDGACCTSSHVNPRASGFSADVCMSTIVESDGRNQSSLVHLIKPLQSNDETMDACPPETVGEDGTVTVYYTKVNHHQLKYYSVELGLPDSVTDENDNVVCSYTHGLTQEAENLFSSPPEYTDEIIKAAQMCPESGRLEYCSMNQYASYLEAQLFDHKNCEVADMPLIDAGSAPVIDIPSAYENLACMYKIFTLKCDCMDAVQQCYAKESKHSHVVSKTVGHAASVLCGFLLCQKPAVYSLFGGENSIQKAALMRELLQKSGFIALQNVTPALAAVVTFGGCILGVLLTKKVMSIKKRNLKVEGGYQNLI